MLTVYFGRRIVVDNQRLLENTHITHIANITLKTLTAGYCRTYIVGPGIGCKHSCQLFGRVVTPNIALSLNWGEGSKLSQRL